MKNITIYTPAKYNTDKYTKVKDNIYKTYDNFMKQDSFVTSLSFEQEPEYGEGESSADISQYPLEDILDRYYVAIEDFYGEGVCLVEWAELVKELIPADAVWITIEKDYTKDDDYRRITIRQEG